MLLGGNVLKKEKSLYWQLFCATFSLSAFTFGGGYVIVPLMREKFVNHYHWIDEQEMLDLVAIGQSSPGPIAVNTSILVGYQMLGIPGALCSMLGTVLPPFLILSVVSRFYAAFMASKTISTLLIGMRAGVAAVITDVVINMAGGIVKTKSVQSILLMIGAFVAVFFGKVNIMYIILVCGSIGLLTSLMKKPEPAVEPTTEDAPPDLVEKEEK